MISRKHLALIHVAKKQLDLDDDSYRHILSRAAGVESAADLDEVGFLNVMEHLTASGFRSTWTKRTFGNRPGMATPSQVDLMRDLWKRYDPSDEGEAHFNAWLFKFHKVSALRFVSADKAKKIIPALKAMASRPHSA
jgi:hypothetical protein